MIRSQARIVVSSRTTWERLKEQLSERNGAPTIVTGKGTRTRRLIRRLFEERSDIEVFSDGDGQWVAIVDPAPGTVHFTIPGSQTWTRQKHIHSVALRRDGLVGYNHLSSAEGLPT